MLAADPVLPRVTHPSQNSLGVPDRPQPAGLRLRAGQRRAESVESEPGC